tara:strand:+ start:70 stop:324 length:255 start_codon:yes stop_codon:yes gene_type:complete
MLNETKLHKISAKIILEKNEKIDKYVFFENKFTNKIFVDLLKESIYLYKIIENKKDIEQITESLDKKRDLTVKFKSLTGIDWSL